MKEPQKERWEGQYRSIWGVVGKAACDFRVKERKAIDEYQVFKSSENR